jgi:nucleosome binding factor SPN SPT16 subunit
LEAFTAHQRIGTLTKEGPKGKAINEWNKALDAAAKKPEIIDIAPAISSLMAVKDEEELVRCYILFFKCFTKLSC